MVVKKYILFLGMIFLMGSVFASFQIGNQSYNLTGIYGPGQNIQGWINVSFSGQLINSMIQDNRGKSVELSKLLDSNTGYSYSCSPVGCDSDYSASNPQSSKTINLIPGQEKIYGFYFQSDLTSIDSISFRLQSNAPEGCVTPIVGDILNDNTKDILSSNMGSENCPYSGAFGCFNATHASGMLTDFTIDDMPYCQQINLSEAPSTSVGVFIKKLSGEKTIIMELYTPEKESVGTCILNSAAMNEVGSEVSCDIDYVIKEKTPYYICIYSGGGTGDYKIQGYSGVDKCGFHGHAETTETFTSAYLIFGKPKRFGAVGTMNVANTLEDGNRISDMVEEYIYDKYGSLDCSQSGCVVPVSFYSPGLTQTVTLSNLIMSYYESGGLISNSPKSFYDLTESPAKVNSDFGKLYVDKGNFTAPSSTGDFNFILSLNGSQMINANLSVGNIPVIESVSPLKTASALPTEFEVKTSGSGNITQFKWEFGDNLTQTTTTKFATHTYNSTGVYTMKVTLKDSLGRDSSNTFTITVGSPEEIIEEMLSENKENLNSVLLQIEEFNVFQKQRIKEILDLESSQTQLESLDAEYNAPGNKTETELNSILTELLGLNIPEYVVKGSSADDLVFYPESPYINLDVLSVIGGGSYEYSQEDSYKESLIAWNQIYLNTRVSFEEIYVSYDGEEKNLITTYEFSISEREDTGDYYFVVENLGDLVFDGREGMSEGEYSYLTLSGSNTISFSTPEEIDFANLPIFISPSISKLDLVDINIVPNENPTKKWFLFGLAIFLLILIGIGVYFALHAWYQKKYEDYLFKDKNNLYNLINYIHASQNKGMEKDEIVKNLRKAKWTNEQINYAMKKYAGKSIGMPGLVDKKIEEISNRAGEGKVAKK